MLENRHVKKEQNKPTVIRAVKRMRDLFRRQGIIYRTEEDISRSVQGFIKTVDRWGLDHELKYIK